MIDHPFELLPSNSRIRMFLVFAGLTFLCSVIFFYLDQPLRTAAAPQGIVSFEMAGSAEKAKAILFSWSEPARIVAAFGLGFDFLFMPAYAATLSIGILLAIKHRKGKWQIIGALLGWGAIAATLFDSIENIALFLTLLGFLTYPFPVLAFICASIKFGLLIGGIVFGIIGWVTPVHKY